MTIVARPVDAGTLDAPAADRQAVRRITPARAAMVEGVRDIVPMVVGVLPFAMAIGTTIGTLDVDPFAALAGAPLILAGAAQLTTLQMLDAGTAPAVIILSALMINARLLLYSASLAPWFASEPLRRRLLLAVPVIDQLHFTCVPRFERGDLDGRGRRAYYTGAATMLVASWVVAQSLSAALGAQLPDALGLRVASPLALAGLLAKSTQNRTATAAAVIAAAVVLIAPGLPFHSVVLVATVVAITSVVIATRSTRSEVRS